MATCFDLLLRVFYGFLLLLLHLYVHSRHEIAPNDLNHGLQVSSGRYIGPLKALKEQRF